MDTYRRADPVAVQVGSIAPEFTLPDSARAPVSLLEFRGKKAVLLVFYPFAFSGVCSVELRELRDDLDTFQNESVQVLAISTDPAPALQAWASEQGFGFPLLSDFWPHGEVAQAYGVFHDQGGMATRGTFLVGADGVVTFAEINGPGEQRDQQSWKRAVQALPAG